MWFVLFLDLNNLEYYGYMPKIPKDREGRVEIYRFDIPREYWDCFEKDFINPVDGQLDALIDIGDVDFLKSTLSLAGSVTDSQMQHFINAVIF